MPCFRTKRKGRNCVICNIMEDQYFRYDLRDLRPGGIVHKAAALQIILENIKNSKPKRVMCIDCYARINHLFDFKRRVGFVPSIMQRGVDVQDMCVICFYYCPSSMSGHVDAMVIKNHPLITKVFHINFLYILNHKKQTCEECMGNLLDFIRLHVTLRETNPEMMTWLSFTTESAPNILQTIEEPHEDIGSLSDENLGLQTLFERNLALDTDSMYNRYFRRRHHNYGERRLHSNLKSTRHPLPTIEEAEADQEQACSSTAGQDEDTPAETVEEPKTPMSTKSPMTPKSSQHTKVQGTPNRLKRLFGGRFRSRKTPKTLQELADQTIVVSDDEEDALSFDRCCEK